MKKSNDPSLHHSENKYRLASSGGPSSGVDGWRSRPLIPRGGPFLAVFRLFQGFSLIDSHGGVLP
jgi:hypothetical protein